MKATIPYKVSENSARALRIVRERTGVPQIQKKRSVSTWLRVLCVDAVKQQAEVPRFEGYLTATGQFSNWSVRQQEMALYLHTVGARL